LSGQWKTGKSRQKPQYTAINQLCIKYPESPFLIGGNANLPDIDWRSDSVINW